LHSAFLVGATDAGELAGPHRGGRHGLEQGALATIGHTEEGYAHPFLTTIEWELDRYRGCAYMTAHSFLVSMQDTGPGFKGAGRGAIIPAVEHMVCSLDLNDNRSHSYLPIDNIMFAMSLQDSFITYCFDN
jgi:hypothetical protein